MEQRIFENNFPMRSALKLPCLNFASGFSQERRWQAQLWPAAMTQNFMGQSTDQNPVIVSLWKLIIIRTKIIWGIFHVWFSNAVMIHKVHILHRKSAKWIIVSDHNSAFHLLFTYSIFVLENWKFWSILTRFRTPFWVLITYFEPKICI